MGAHWAAIIQTGVTAAGVGAVVRQITLTRASVEQAQVLVRESVRSRLDDRAPALLVVFDSPEWPPTRAAGTVGARGAQLGRGEAFRLPGEAASRVEVHVAAKVTNVGPRTVLLELQPPLKKLEPADPDSENARHAALDEAFRVAAGAVARVPLEPGRCVTVVLEGSLTVADWADNAGVDVREMAAVEGVIAVHSTEDSGVSDRYRLRLTGTPLQAIEGELQGYRLRGVPMRWGTAADPLVTELRHERVYWLSRSAGVPLPAEPEVRHLT